MPVRELFVTEQVLPRTYMETLASGLGRAWVEWEPETLRQEIQKTWNIDPSVTVFEKIMALQTLLKTDLFWDAILPFEKTVHAFNDLYVDPDLIQAAHPREIAFGMTVALDLRPKKDFIKDIEEYIRACHREYGVLVFHPVLAQWTPQYDGFRKQIVEFVSRMLAENKAFPEKIDQSNAIEVQYMKAWDVNMYVEERLQRGRDIASAALKE